MINNGVIELTLDECADELELLKFEHGICTLRITENFDRIGLRTYVVNNLQMEFEDDIVYCSDTYNILHKNYCVLMSFLREGVISIKKIIENENSYGEILFKDGNIRITTLK